MLNIVATENHLCDDAVRFSVECECGWKISGPTEAEVKEAADFHNMMEHPDQAEIRWEWIQ